MIPGSRISSMLLQLFQHCSHEGLVFQACSQEEPSERSVLPCSVRGIPGVPPCSTGVTRFTVLTEGGGETPLQWRWQLIRKQLLTPSYSLGPGLSNPESSVQSCRGQCDGRRWTQGRITLSRLGASFLCRSEAALHI